MQPLRPLSFSPHLTSYPHADSGTLARRPDKRFRVPIEYFDQLCLILGPLFVGLAGAFLFASGRRFPGSSEWLGEPVRSLDQLIAATIDGWAWFLGGVGAIIVMAWSLPRTRHFKTIRGVTVLSLMTTAIVLPADILERLTPAVLAFWLTVAVVLPALMSHLIRAMRRFLIARELLRWPRVAVLNFGARTGMPFSASLPTGLSAEIIAAINVDTAWNDDLKVTLTGLGELTRSGSLDSIVVRFSRDVESQFEGLIGRLATLPVDILLQSPPTSTGTPFDDFISRPFVLHRQPHRGWSGLAKDALERGIATTALLVLLPLLLIVAIAVKLDSEGPVLFHQKRYGYGHRPFSMLKFRTMFNGSEDRSGALQTSREDPRVTRLGRWLRRTSIDELPQLINVLLGDMALVGPRAHPVAMRIGEELYDVAVEQYAARHRVKPGITGLAQVSGNRGAVLSLEQAKARVALDLRYVQNWSLMLDLRILLSTVVHLFVRKEAY